MSADDAADLVASRLAAIDRFLEDRGIDPATAAIVGIALVGTLARLVYLGERVAHFDEGRVGYWIVHFLETGEFHYRFQIHGPLVQHVNTVVFSVLGANDFTLRLVVALIGGLLPLGVLLLREHLDGDEMVAAALFLAFNPVVLYYSRFFRSTIPVAAFSFFAFGMLVRYYDTRRPRYVHAATFFVSLAFAAKENAVVYLVVWLGASALILEHRLYRSRTVTPEGRLGRVEPYLPFIRLHRVGFGLPWLRERWRAHLGEGRWRETGPRFLEHALASIVLFVALTFFFYAPRAGTPGGVGLYEALANPALFPDVVSATVADLEAGFDHWVGGSTESGSRYGSVLARYVDYAGRTLQTLVFYAGPLVAFAIIGTLVDRFGSGRSRSLIAFAAYWGFVSAIGYPLGTDIINAVWITVNALVPLAIPAGVGVALLYRWGRDALEDDDRISAAIVALLLIIVAGQVALVDLNSVYRHPQSDETGALVQYGQPIDDLRPTLQDVRELSKANEGTDVVFYGSNITYDLPEDHTWDPAEEVYPPCVPIGNTLPLQWYLAIYDANATCANSPEELERMVDERAPPVIITTPGNVTTVRRHVPGYVERKRQIFNGGGARVFFLDRDRL